MEVDVVIFGGGSAGLWLIDELSRSGLKCLLIERFELGAGQTISSQGIIHGGLKYTLSGQLNGSAQQIKDMPGRWLASLQGKQEPDLRAVAWRGSYCHLWRTDSLSSQLGMIGARIGLQVTPEKISDDEVPEFLDPNSTQIFKLPETVIAPSSFIQVFRERNFQSLLKISDLGTLEFMRDKSHQLWGVRLLDGGKELFLRSSGFVFTAGRGNEALRQEAGLTEKMMQRRPLHMLMLKGDLPDFCGHCVDGAKTRVTITSERISPEMCIWQVGGNIAEVGVKMLDWELIEFGYQELKAVLPRMKWEGVEAATYHIDRAEGKTALGSRPEQPIILQEENVITCWPTKLALVPIAVAQMTQQLQKIVTTKVKVTHGEDQVVLNWAKPEVARQPWEVVKRWVPFASTEFMGKNRKNAA